MVVNAYLCQTTPLMSMDIDKHMRAIRKYLKEEKKMTKVDEMTLELLKADLEMLERIKEELVERTVTREDGTKVKVGGMTTIDRYGAVVPSPFLKEQDRVTKRILEYERKLGLSPYDRKKLAVAEADDESPLDAFINGGRKPKGKADDDINLPNQIDIDFGDL